MIQIINCIEIDEIEYLLDSQDSERIKEMVVKLQDRVMEPLGFSKIPPNFKKEGFSDAIN